MLWHREKLNETHDAQDEKDGAESLSGRDPIGGARTGRYWPSMGKTGFVRAGRAYSSGQGARVHRQVTSAGDVTSIQAEGLGMRRYLSPYLFWGAET